MNANHEKLDAWVDSHFDEEVRFLQALVQVPTDTPPGNNAPHAERTAELLAGFGFDAEHHPVPAQEVRGYGLESITNLIVRRRFGAGGPTIALNAHGDVVPPGEGWTHDPYGGEIVDGKLYGRASAVSKSDFATYTFALRALEALGANLAGGVELHFTYDEEFGGELGPGWLLRNKLTEPDLLLAAGFSYQVVTAHNGCLQMEVTVHGRQAHVAIPDTGVDALQGAVAILNALYAQNALYKAVQTQPRLVSFGAMALLAVGGQERRDVAREIDRLVGRRRQFLGPGRSASQQHDHEPVSAHVKLRSRGGWRAKAGRPYCNRSLAISPQK